MSASTKPQQRQDCPAVARAPEVPSETELLLRRLVAVETMSHWKVELQAKQRRLDLCAEMIGVEPGEIEQLEQEVARFTRCSKAILWNPEGGE
jgi:hypothetical protein